ALGTTTVACTATDTSGNSASASFPVTVRDTTAPTVAVPAGPTAEATGPDGAEVTYPPPSATDVVDGTDAVSCAPASGSTFALGATTVACTAEDAAGNTGTASFHVTVRDTTGPVIQPTGVVTVEEAGTTGVVVDYPLPTATDAV